MYRESVTGGIVMITWIAGNLATIIISAILVIIVAAVIASMVSNKRKGKTSCGCGCAGCTMSGACHPAKPGTKNQEAVRFSPPREP